MSSTIGLIFDFDDTLAPDSTTGFLASRGVDIKKFWQQDVQNLLDQGWDPVPAYLYQMIEESRRAGTPYTKNDFQDFAHSWKFHEGVTRFFAHLREHLADHAPDVSLEFYLISSGIGDIVRNTRISRHFHQIWASEFHYDGQGAIAFPKKIVSFTDKTRYLYQIAKGMTGPEYGSKPFEVNKKVPQLHIPLDQMVFTGDGFTDIPCFSVIRKAGGVAVGVYNPEHKGHLGRAWGFVDQGRVHNLHAARFGQDSDLYRTLTMAVDGLAEKIRQRQKG